MSDMDRNSNIILNNHRQVLDYRTNESYSRKVDEVTAYVSGAIDFSAYVIFASAQLSVRAFVAFIAACRQVEDWGQQAGEIYHDKGMDERLLELVNTVKQKVDEYRQPDTVALTSSAIDIEAEPMPVDLAETEESKEGEFAAY